MRTQAVWVLRILWFFLPLTVGQVASDAIASAAHAVPQVMTVGLWVLWAAGTVAAVIPHPVTLTLLRILAPGPLVLSLWAAFDLDWTAVTIVALAHSALLLVVAMTDLIGDRFVDGASYGDERRLLLRPPAAVAYVVVPLLWATMALGLTAGPLLLADKRWVFGLASLITGFAVVAVGARALHQLNQRWIVFVPTGMVVHDLSALTEPVLFRRTAIERLGPAIAGSPAKDLSRGASGLLLECELTDAAPLGLRTGSRDRAADATMADVRRFLFAPTRPGALLDEAERRNIAVD